MSLGFITRLGVTRKVEDCRKLAKDRGCTAAEEYVDNDVSAFSGKVRGYGSRPAQEPHELCCSSKLSAPRGGAQLLVAPAGGR